ncbi:hypothetical protein [Phycicoccus sp.]|uniref:hypothetical protein n=1 Tax=Phycicoccus sp. TaxID=1902410 RepID=UPI002CD8A16C|nr:hypothetical protein [Phycicoccus sp.]HMM95326.1 hypothetical protein [Phycicoccus sp.]
MNDTQPTTALYVNSYSEALDILATSVRLMLDHTPGLSIYDAVLRVAASTVEEGDLAAARCGRWAAETTTAQIENALFMAVVAEDVIDGTVARPSVGNIRNALIHRAARA